MRRYEITDRQWELISPLLPGKSGDVGRTALDNRLFLNAVLWVARSGAPWRDLPGRFGPWNSVYVRFRRWAVKGVWQGVFDALQDPDLDWLMVDSTVVRAHQHAAGQKKATRRGECLGRSAGGWSTKVHAAVDALGNPLRIKLTVGQRGDATQARALVEGYRPGAVLADRGYDADDFLGCVREAGAEAVIPSKRNRLHRREIDQNLYKDRNKVERFFNRLKACRRIATRYDKTADSFAGFVYLASIMILLH
ncbi:IS5 family transposase [Rufibacter sediminis]|uniref:IS5 family transposase n=1 Tax=Rufibacter sediminis TaxID=2762756 RepID=UPI00374390BD